MNHVVGDMPGCAVYLDDGVVYSDSHVAHVRELFTLLVEAGLTVNLTSEPPWPSLSWSCCWAGPRATSRMQSPDCDVHHSNSMWMPVMWMQAPCWAGWWPRQGPVCCCWFFSKKVYCMPEVLFCYWKVNIGTHPVFKAFWCSCHEWHTTSCIHRSQPVNSA